MCDHCVWKVLNDFSCNLHLLFPTSLASQRPCWPYYKHFDLFTELGSSTCRPEHITGKWSAEQNGWQGLRRTGQWVVGVLGVKLGGGKTAECQRWGQELGWKKVRNREESRHPGTLCAVHMTPCALSKQKDVPASTSVHHIDSSSWATSVH